MEYCTIEQIAERENELILTAQSRYGKYYETALACDSFLSNFLKSIDNDRWVFASFLSQITKHHTLALFSVLRLHRVQARMNLRQTLEAGTCAAYAIAFPDHNAFVDADEYGILDASKNLTRKRYQWLDENYSKPSGFIKEIKNQINDSTAHANLINTHGTFGADYENKRFLAPFFDIEDEFYVKSDLWLVSNIALVLMDFFSQVNTGRNVIKFADDFSQAIEVLAKNNDTLKIEMTSNDRYKNAMSIKRMREK